jgi:hypothetical protein
MTVKNIYAAPTDKQLKFAEALASKKGFRHLSQAYKACFGKNKVGGFNRSETSQLIDWLQK